VKGSGDGGAIASWCRSNAAAILRGYIARSVSSGLFWAMTPTIGVQMAMVMAHWLLVQKFWPRKDFSVVQSMAWTWVTNFLTMIPVYYMFYVTGQLFLGHFDDLTGYQGFVDLWNGSFGAGSPGSAGTGVAGWWENLWHQAQVRFVGWGVPMLVGCVPYAVVAAWLGYRWSLKLVTGHRRNVAHRRMARAHDQVVDQVDDGVDDGAHGGA